MSHTRWSNSALQTLQQCGEKFRRRYIEKDRRPANLRMMRGSSIHRAAQHNHLRQLDVKRELTEQKAPLTEIANAMRASLIPEETVEVATADFERRIAKEEWEPEKGTSRDQQVDENRTFVVDLAGFHTREVAPRINPERVEHRVSVRPQDSDIVITGVFDLVGRDIDGFVLSDLKTGVKTPNRNAAERSQQLSMYALLFWALEGELPAKLRLDYMVRTPARHTKSLVSQHTHRSEQDLLVITERLNVAVDAVDQGIFMPAPADAWWCDPRYCDYFLTCKYVNPFRK